MIGNFNQKINFANPFVGDNLSVLCVCVVTQWFAFKCGAFSNKILLMDSNGNLESKKFSHFFGSFEKQG